MLRLKPQSCVWVDYYNEFTLWQKLSWRRVKYSKLPVKLKNNDVPPFFFMVKCFEEYFYLSYKRIVNSKSVLGYDLSGCFTKAYINL